MLRIRQSSVKNLTTLDICQQATGMLEFFKVPENNELVCSLRCIIFES